MAISNSLLRPTGASTLVNGPSAARRPLVERLGGEPSANVIDRRQETFDAAVQREFASAQAALLHAQATGAPPQELQRLTTNVATAADAMASLITSGITIPKPPERGLTYGMASVTRAGATETRGRVMPSAVRSDLLAAHAGIDQAYDRALKQAWATLPRGPGRDALVAKLTQQRQERHDALAVFTGDDDRIKARFSQQLAAWTTRTASLAPDEIVSVSRTLTDSFAMAMSSGDLAGCERAATLLRSISDRAGRTGGREALEARELADQAATLMQLGADTLRGTPEGDQRALAGLAKLDKKPLSPDLGRTLLSARIELLGRRGLGSPQRIEDTLEALAFQQGNSLEVHALRFQYLDAGIQAGLKGFAAREFVATSSQELLEQYGRPTKSRDLLARADRERVGQALWRAVVAA